MSRFTAVSSAATATCRFSLTKPSKFLCPREEQRPLVEMKQEEEEGAQKKEKWEAFRKWRETEGRYNQRPNL